jgi:hypothetical protein
VQLEAALAAAATLVATAFCLATLERWQARRKRHELAWTMALALFAGGSAALWLGAALGWGEWSFKAFFWCGAVANVPLLAVGTVYLLAGERWGDRAFAGTVLFVVFAAGWIFAAPLVGPVPVDELPRGKEVFGPVPRIFAAVASGLGALVLFGGAAWSAIRLLRVSGRTATGPVSPRRLAATNGLIAAGTLVLSAGGLLNSALGEMDAFSVSLVAGVSLIFAGFLLTSPSGRPGATDHAIPAWIDEVLTEPPATVGAAQDRPAHSHRAARRSSRHAG